MLCTPTLKSFARVWKSYGPSINTKFGSCALIIFWTNLKCNDPLKWLFQLMFYLWKYTYYPKHKEIFIESIITDVYSIHKVREKESEENLKISCRHVTVNNNKKKTKPNNNIVIIVWYAKNTWIHGWFNLEFYYFFCFSNTVES